MDAGWLLDGAIEPFPGEPIQRAILHRSTLIYSLLANNHELWLKHDKYEGNYFEIGRNNAKYCRPVGYRVFRQGVTALYCCSRCARGENSIQGLTDVLRRRLSLSPYIRREAWRGADIPFLRTNKPAKACTH